jgi:hypothetical protein
MFYLSAKRFCLTVTRSKENLTVGLMLQCGTKPEVVTSSLDLQYQGNINFYLPYQQVILTFT